MIFSHSSWVGETLQKYPVAIIDRGDSYLSSNAKIKFII